MGHLKDISNQPTRQSFPGAQFEAAGLIPKPECTKALVEGEHGHIAIGLPFLTDSEAFGPPVAIGHFVTILFPDIDLPTRQIIFVDPSFIQATVPYSQTSNDVVYYVHDGGVLEDQHTAQTLMKYALDHGAAATMKGGKLYTDMEFADIGQACKILFDPLT